MQLRAALPVRVDGVLYEVRRTTGGVAVAGLTQGAPGQEPIAAAAVRRICGHDPTDPRWQGTELILAVAACPALDA